MRTQNLLLICLVWLFFSCKKDKEITPDTNSVSPELKLAAVTTYADIVHASYEDAYNKVLVLKQKAADFLTTPSQAGYDAMKAAYIDARVPYEQTEAYRFYGGPIDDENGPEGLINAWPLNEAYMDYVIGDPTAGIINDPSQYPTIDKDFLAGANGVGKGEEENVSCGYHAIEFLLWGQDTSAGGPGSRPYTDYVTGAGGTASNQARRGAYLQAAIDLLADHLNYLIDGWKPGVNNNYRAAFVANPDNSLKLLLSGAAEFAKGELAGQRMTPAYTLQDQEEEHSCFSDQTHNDIILGQRSIYNVYIGKYVRTDGTVIDGTGIDDLVKAVNPSLNTEMISRLDAATAAASAILPPFDQEINEGHAGGRARVLATINALKAEADKLVEAAASLGIILI